MWFIKAIAHHQDGSIPCLSDLTGTYVFPTLFEQYPIFTIFDMELQTMDVTEGFGVPEEEG